MFYFNRDLNPEIVEPGEIRIVRAHGGTLMMAEFRYEKGGRAKLHSHPHEQVAYIIEGELDFTVGEETQHVVEGDSIYIPSGVVHGCEALTLSRVLDVFSPQREDFI